MRKALIVGIDEYPHARLRACINDARLIGSLLEKHADGSRNFDVEYKLNIPTKAELRKHISRLFDHDGEISLFYFSGHGYVDHMGGHIITPDFKLHDVGVSMDDLLKIASHSRARHKIIILDCCHAGAMGTPAFGSNTASYLEKGVTIFAASMDNQTALEKEGHGIFTKLLTDALAGGAADIPGEIRPGHIYSYIDRALGAWQQRPVFKENIVESVCLRKVHPSMPLNELRKITEYFPEPTYLFQLDPTYQNSVPGAIPEHVAIFRVLRRMHVLRLIEVPDEEYLYYATIKSKCCQLSSLGVYYWNLIKNGRI
ncbi:caspase family protein [Terrimonas sp. NA20]|uniref:Caspase family protein n=1 Tax=Terrimonas ginsenosidimutans TaxID=2908004 RepID=A0ABS9KKA4_9BACT|nr:caspase family protein [Terrimonas ginsenosidimutans]MCG2612744.1 caspase family protein [Terrimonas ginsenosidimutans]